MVLAVCWSGAVLLAGGVVSKNQVFAAWLCFSSPPRLLFFLQVLIAITPGWGEVRAAETNGCCQVAGLGWEERAASQPALCYTGGLQGCCCPPLHSTSRGSLGEVSILGRKGAFPSIWPSAPDKRVLPLAFHPSLAAAWSQLAGTGKIEPKFGPECIPG